MFSRETYVRRRAQLKSGVKSGILLFLGNNEAPMNYPSNTYRYRQDSNFNYFFGLHVDHLSAIIDVDENKEILFGDDYTIDDIIWMGDQASIKFLADQCGISETRTFASFADYIHNAQKSGRKVHYLPPYRDDNKILLHKILNIPFEDLKSSASVEMIKAIVALRECKTSEEIEEMDKVCNLGVDMHLSAMHGTKPGVLERTLAGVAEGITMSGGRGVSFPVILSQNGETLHNHNHEQYLEDGRMLLVDAGAEAMSGYSSDYTRTYPVKGKFTQKQREIYEIVLQANMETFELAKPGIRYFDVHLNAYKVIAKGLTDIGLMKGNPEDAARDGAPALFMPHGLGHMLGLDVHDMEDLGEDYVGYDKTIQRSRIFGHGSLRCAKTLKPGFIVTDEPGIYFIPQLIHIWEKEKKFEQYINYAKVKEYIGFGGIRIEDDVLITENGCRLLGKPLPKKVDDLEAVIGK